MNIRFGKDKYILIDDEDYDKVKGLCLYSSGRNGYVKLKHNGKAVFLHRFLLGLKEDDKYLVDHKNGDKLDNRKANLRLCTKAENAHNIRKLSQHNSSGYKGVFFDKYGDRWRAKIQYMGKSIFLGSFKSALEAAKAYDRAAKQYFGEFACTNAAMGLL